MSEIEDAYNGTVRATLTNGQIKLTAITDGTSSLTVSAFTFNDNTGGETSMDLPTFALEGDEGGTIVDGDLITGFKVADFLETQSAQDSKIKVDGYPPDSTTAEEQTLTNDTQATSGTYYLGYEGHKVVINATDDAATVKSKLETLDNVSSDDIAVAGNSLSTAGGGGFTFTFSSDAGDVSLITFEDIDLDPSGIRAITETTQGTDGWISRSTNSVDDVVGGVTLALQDDTYNGATYDTVEVTLTRNTEALKEKLDTMIEAYNEFVKFMKENAEYEPTTKSSGPLYGNYSITSVSGQIKSLFSFVAKGFTSDDSFFLPSDIGLKVDSDDMLSLNSSDLDDAIAEDYAGVLELIGAMNKGSSNSDIIKFYAGGANTTAGTYNVEVKVEVGEITEAWIWGSDETYADKRAATFEAGSNVIVGDASFTDGYPDHPENSLTMTVDLTTNGTFTAIVYVKQGFAGATKDLLDDILKTETGRLDVSQNSVRDAIDRLNERIDTEQRRLESIENRLILKFARLERTLAMLNQQMSALGI